MYKRLKTEDDVTQDLMQIQKVLQGRTQIFDSKLDFINHLYSSVNDMSGSLERKVRLHKMKYEEKSKAIYSLLKNEITDMNDLMTQMNQDEKIDISDKIEKLNLKPEEKDIEEVRKVQQDIMRIKQNEPINEEKIKFIKKKKLKKNKDISNRMYSPYMKQVQIKEELINKDKIESNKDSKEDEVSLSRIERLQSKQTDEDYFISRNNTSSIVAPISSK